MKGVGFLWFPWGCLLPAKTDKWLTGERFLKVISSYRQDLRKHVALSQEDFGTHLLHLSFQLKGYLNSGVLPLLLAAREFWERDDFLLWTTPTRKSTGMCESTFNAKAFTFLLLLGKRIGSVLPVSVRECNLYNLCSRKISTYRKCVDKFLIGSRKFLIQPAFLTIFSATVGFIEHRQSM